MLLMFMLCMIQAFYVLSMHYCHYSHVHAFSMNHISESMHVHINEVFWVQNQVLHAFYGIFICYYHDAHVHVLSINICDYVNITMCIRYSKYLHADKVFCEQKSGIVPCLYVCWQIKCLWMHLGVVEA